MEKKETSEEIFRKRLNRLQRWVDRVSRVWQSTLSELEGRFVNLLHEMEEAKLQAEQSIANEEERIKAQLDQAGKEFVKGKYLYEKESTQNKSDIEHARAEFEATKQHLSAELGRLNQEKLTNQMSFERQKSALQDLYQEKKRHLLVTREKMIRELTQSQANHLQYKSRYDRELESLRQDGEQKIQILNDQLNSKKQGWDIARETMKKELETLSFQKIDVEKKLASIHSEKDQQLSELHMQMEVAKEQLELDKVSLLEKAEEDQRALEKELQDLQADIQTHETALQNLILQKESEKKTSEEGFSNEENTLKSTLKNESEKRDYEQKLFNQEKLLKEKELAQMKEEFEKKKMQWDNQLKTLLMQKSLQDADHNSDRMRTDREARVVVRSLEAKRDELKQHLAEVRSRSEAYQANASKELELLKQRWQWRKDRLWQMWQARLATIKKERQVLGEQLENLVERFQKEKQSMTEEFHRSDGHVEDVRQSILQGQDQWDAERRQREIQLELEKTRIIAQIKECETLVTDWLDQQKLTHETVTRRKGAFVDDMDFLDQYYRSQQDETELFLNTLQRALELLKDELGQLGLKQDAA